jgi:hypothetical protein
MTTNITDELCRLAELRENGHLTEQEFADAKRRLLNAERPAPVKDQDRKQDGFIDFEERTYQSSRWTAGNLFFKDALVLASDGIIFRKGNLFGSTEEHINYSAVASFRIHNGILFSNVWIETAGGSQPIVVNGLWKAEAKEIQDTIRSFQRRVPMSN